MLDLAKIVHLVSSQCDVWREQTFVPIPSGRPHGTNLQKDLIAHSLIVHNCQCEG